jgi:hypothetical protein
MRVGMIDTQALRERWNAVVSNLDERERQVFAVGGGSGGGMGRPESDGAHYRTQRSTINRQLTALDAEAPHQDHNEWPVAQVAPEGQRTAARATGAPSHPVVGFSERPRLAGPVQLRSDSATRFPSRSYTSRAP